MQSFGQRLRTFLQQPDAKQRPVRALVRRVYWKLFKALRPNAIYHRKNWYRGMAILIPQSGTAAQIFYRDISDQATVDFINESLRPGMVFVDIGAHAGEYSLIAAQLVGSTGRVVAVEPQEHCANVIRKNFSINHFAWGQVGCYALDSSSGKAAFLIDKATSGGTLDKIGRFDENVVLTDTCTLDEMFRRERMQSADVIKLDAGGNEYGVLLAAESYMRSAKAPTLIVKFYNSNDIKARFGHDAEDLRVLLTEWGFSLRGNFDGYAPSILAIPPRPL